MEAFLDRLHARARRSPVLQRLAVISRILLAVGFIPTALVKVLGRRFMTTVVPGDPISDLFEALYRSGGYWRFIGLAQVTAGVLLLVPRTATLGAVLFFPIILNIFVITVALDFGGTPVVTGLMLLASFFLLCWDYHRLKAVLWAPADPLPAPARPAWSPLERAGYALGTAAALVLLMVTRGLAPVGAARACIALGLVAAAMVLAAWIAAARRRSAPGTDAVDGRRSATALHRGSRG